VEADYDLIVAGGGPAGSACAITAARKGARVLLVEKSCFPRHKVCGEFVSSESLRLLAALLEGDLFQALPQIASARIFLDGKMFAVPVSPPARSIPRFNLDSALLTAAKNCGVNIRQESTVTNVNAGETFKVELGSHTVTARAVVNATGRWSQLTRFDAAGGKKWVGLKAHFTEWQPAPSVDLYFFASGYCGVQPVDENVINVCAMVRADAATSLDEVFALQPELWRRSRGWEQRFATITTSGLYFRKPETSDRGMLLAGDSAGFVDPFVGDGISLALQSGALAAQNLLPFLAGRSSLTDVHRQYGRAYRERLAPAFRNAARIRRLLSAPGWVRSTAMTIAGRRLVAELLLRSTRARTAE
jgi:flavin-dependent dehydrogenase